MTFLTIFGALLLVTWAVAPGCGGLVVIVYHILKFLIWLLVALTRGVVHLIRHVAS